MNKQPSLVRPAHGALRQSASSPRWCLMSRLLQLLGLRKEALPYTGKNTDYFVTQAAGRTQLSAAKDQFFMGLVEVRPEYRQGGYRGMKTFLQQHLRPSCPQRGVVQVEFVIDTEGKVIAPSVLRGLGQAPDSEVLKVVSQMEFMPGRHEGRVVAVRYILSVQYN